eukprot:6870409-Pyramimonas_sp.AAC.1
MSPAKPGRAAGPSECFATLACRLLVLPALCGVPNGGVALLIGASDAGYPAGAGSCCDWARHGSLVHSMSVEVIPLGVMPITSALWA